MPTREPGPWPASSGCATCRRRRRITSTPSSTPCGRPPSSSRGRRTPPITSSTWRTRTPGRPSPCSPTRRNGRCDYRALPDNDENLIRESYMRRCVREVLAQGHKPERVVVVCGAFHAPALTHDLPPMSDKELKALPQVATRLTLMPYSYARLS